jgi:amino acid adenylation domain-containing protein
MDENTNSGTVTDLLGADEVFVFPLSFAQQRLWVLDRLEPDSAVYNIPIALRVKGLLQLDAIRASLNAIFRRHEVLRASFREQDGSPVQIIFPPTPLPIPLVDLSQLPPSRQEEEATRLAREDAHAPFDLSHGPVLRASILKLDEQDHVLLLNVHHIVFDGWSRHILLRELTLNYAAYSTNLPSPLPELAIQYTDYAVWQREFLSGEVLEKQVSYWREQLAGAPSHIELPTDRPRPLLQTFNGAHESRLLSRSIVDALKTLSRKENVTFFMTLLAAFNVLLSRYSGQEDVVVGSPIAGRSRAEVENLIGLFVNMLALRTDLSGNPSFSELLRRVRETCLKAYAHQDLPFEKLVEEIKPERDLGQNPIFQVMFALQNLSTDSEQTGGLSITPFRVGGGTNAKFDLTLTVSERHDGLATNFEYNTDIFDSATIQAMQEHWHTLLQGIVADPDRAVSDLPLLSADERNRTLIAFNQTDADYRQDACFHQLFEEQVERTPNAVALVSGQKRVTYVELNRRANQIANHLLARGLKSGSLVGVYLERSPEMVVAILGVLKAGAAYVPLDPAYPSDRIKFIVEDSQLQILLTQKSLIEQLPADPSHVVCLDAELSAITSQPATGPSTNVKSEDLAYVLYTSGSTGKPKGVQIQHRSLVNFLTSMAKEPGLHRDDILLAVTTLSFDIAGLELFLPLTVGASIVLATREQAVDGAQLLRLMNQSSVTVMQATPSTWRMLIESGWKGNPELKVLCGGEALPRELAEQLLPRCRQLWNMYGPTETTIWSSIYRVTDVNWSAAPIGRPIANTQMYVLDKHLQPVPAGVIGELYIGGDGVAQGYWRRPELTAERFIPDPFRANTGARLYRTGDQVRYLRNGNIQYLGRLDTQVKVRGYRIELGEIESVLATHPTVEQAAVVVREDSPGDPRLVAYLVLKPGESSTVAEWRTHLKASLPEYMVPSSFVCLDQFPLTPNRKIDRRALPRPESNTEPSEATSARDELEALLLSIWKRVLGVASVGITDNFFELGGHSLLAVRLLSEIEKATGRAIPLAALFRGATVEYLARIVREEGTPRHQVILSIQEGGSQLPFFGIVTPGMNALGYIALARHLGPDQPLYRIQGPGARLKGRSYTKAEFENLAAEYIDAMKTVQPQGPYYLGGMCEGARIAFDMARILEARGEEVGLLAIFDTWVLENSQVRFLWKIDYYSGRLKRFKALPAAEKRKFLRQWFKKRVKQLPQAPQPEGSDWPTMYWPGKDFVPEKFGRRITLFKIPKQPFFYVRDPLMGWGTRTRADVDLHVVESKHGFFMREPYVRDLARKLSECLRQSRLQRSEVNDHSTDAQTAADRFVLSSGRASL